MYRSAAHAAAERKRAFFSIDKHISHGPACATWSIPAWAACTIVSYVSVLGVSASTPPHDAFFFFRHNSACKPLRTCTTVPSAHASSVATGARATMVNLSAQTTAEGRKVDERSRYVRHVSRHGMQNPTVLLREARQTTPAVRFPQASDAKPGGRHV